MKISTSLVLAFFFFASLNIKVFAQASDVAIMCVTPGQCNVNIGVNHAEAIRHEDHNFVIYKLIYSDFTFNEYTYINPEKSGQQVTTLKFAGFKDLLWSWAAPSNYGYFESNGLCMGGRYCGHNNSLYFPASYSSGKTITKIEVTGHDRLGDKCKAGLALYEGDKRLGLISVKKKGGTYTFNIDHNLSQPLRLTSIRKDGNTQKGDETMISKIKIYVNDR